MEREAASAGKVRADGMVVDHHRERPVHGDVGVHQAPELLRVVVPLVSRYDHSPEARWDSKRNKQLATRRMRKCNESHQKRRQMPSGIPGFII